MKKFNDLKNQLASKGTSATEKKVGKVLANDMLNHVSGGAPQDSFWIRATWRLRF